jgi:nucleoside-diphosphate-sugar epimerase
MPTASKKILFLGGTGYIGSYFQSYFLKNNLEEEFDLTIASRKNPNNSKFRHLSLDVSKKFVMDEDYDYVVNGAFSSFGTESNQTKYITNTILNGTFNLVDALNNIKSKARVINLSSGAVYGLNHVEKVPFKENDHRKSDLTHPKDLYGSCKYLSELILNNNLNPNIEVIHLRIFCLSGYFHSQESHFAIEDFVKKANEKKDIIIKGNGKSIRSYLDIDDLCDVLISSFSEGKNKESYNIGSSEAISISELAALISNTSNTHSKINILNQDNYENYYVPNVNKAKDELKLKENILLKNSIKKMIKN